MTYRSRIDAAKNWTVWDCHQTSRLILLLRDTAGQKLSFSLPTNCLDSHATSPIIVASQDQPSANRHPSRRVALQMRKQHCADAFRNLVGGIMPDTR
jgi:hypothetical protein